MSSTKPIEEEDAAPVRPAASAQKWLREDDDAVDEDTGLSGRQVAALKQSLLAERDKLVGRFRDHVDTAISSETIGLSDEMDLATRDQEQAYLLRLADKERKLVREIDEALARIGAGTFGICEGTGEPIGLRRLQARPWARYSIAYKEQLERDESSRIRE